METLCLFSGLSNKKSRGSTQATTAATATAATTPSKKRKRLTRSSQRAGDSPVMPARFISLGWRIKDCLAARLG